MIKLLADLQRFKILPEDDISFFLNENQRGKRILVCPMIRFHKFHSTVGIFYSRFKEEFIRESSPALEIADLFKCELRLSIAFSSFSGLQRKLMETIHKHHSFFS
jgi:hypothetical protein